MAAGWGRFFILLLVISLVVAGLNVSNYGISQLTMEDRGEVLNVRLKDGDIVFTALGKEYVYGDYRNISGQDFYQLAKEIEDYLRKIWRIFQAVFLYDVGQQSALNR